MGNGILAGVWRRSVGWRVVLAMALGLVALDANALRNVDPGEEPKLAPNEGLLVISVDTDTPVSTMRFTREGSSLGGDALHAVKEGRTRQMYVVPAGRYRWSKITVVNAWYWTGAIELSDSEEFSFEVKPAQISYAGDLVYRSTGGMKAVVHLSNRSLPIIDWLLSSHPALYSRLPLVYSGYYPDPFPSFYREVGAQLTTSPKDPDATREPPKPAPLTLAPELLWKPSRVTDVAISPDGKLAVEALRDGDKRWVELIDLVAGKSQRLLASDMPIEDLSWDADRTLLVTTTSSAGSWIHAYHIGDPVNGRLSYKRVDGPVGGTIVDMLPDEPGTVLYQNRNSDGELVVHRLRMYTQESADQFRHYKTKDRLNVGVRDDLLWFADGHGRLRVVLAKRGDEAVLMHGKDGQYREVLRYQADGGFHPVMLSYDGELIYGFTDGGRSQRDLVVFDPATGQVARTIYSKPGIDLRSARFDDRRNPIGASYYRSGQLVTDYFDQANQHLDQLLREAFAGRTVSVMGRSRHAEQALLYVDASDRPPQLYLLDVERGIAQLLDETAPQLAERTFARADVLKVKGTDGLPVDAFLTVPSGRGKRPLVVMPHGGPIGISDDLHFNREVQFLASLGYAVLQVNYRGSEGYGKAFREAGYRNQGKLIEDDIDAAIKVALAQYPLDEGRMCMVGASYGGYSAMVSTIRWPGRFRCVVSLAGVSDRALFFTASDSGRDAKIRELMERIIGNPNVAADIADMKATSPLYRFRDLTVPMMLLHGQEDLRVDYEHTRRLVRMLNLAGQPPVLLSFANEGHGLDDLRNIEAAWTGIAGFLGAHLGREGQAAAPVAGANASSSVAH